MIREELRMREEGKVTEESVRRRKEKIREELSVRVQEARSFKWTVFDLKFIVTFFVFGAHRIV